MIILLGKTGYLANAYRRFFERKGVDFHALSRSEVDYTNAAVLEAWLRKHQPAFLLNAAGYPCKPNVDACEKDKTHCLLGNTILPGVVAEVCAKLKLPWGHVSSGCIYTGKREDGGGFTEEDPPNFCFRTNNCSFYSGTKALGEEVLAGEEQVYIWRMRIPFNHEDGPRNYLSKLMRYATLLEAENSISHLDDFVKLTWDCYSKKCPYGIYNVTNPGSVTTRQVVKLLGEYGLADHDFRFFANEAEFMREAAITPRSNCVLNTDKLTRAGLRMRPVEEALRDALEHWIVEAK
jgi:dTDP-4-dehydrorhamnose reductase